MSVNIFDKNTKTLQRVDGGNGGNANILSLTKAEWAAYDRTNLKDGTQVNIIDDTDAEDIEQKVKADLMTWLGTQYTLTLSGTTLTITDK